MRKNLAEEQLPEKFKLLEAMMDATYCCGDSLTLADFYVYGLLNWIGMNTLDGVPHTIILECGSASQSARSRRWRSGRRDSVGDPRRRRDVLRTGHANAGYEAAMARLAQVELDPRIPLEDEAGPRLRVAHYAQVLAYFGTRPPVPAPPPVDMRRRNMLRVLEANAVSDEATTPA